MTNINKTTMGYGHKQSDATKQKIRDARAKQKMKPMSEETKLKISKSNKGKSNPRKGTKGLQKHSEETKRKISENNKNGLSGFQKGNKINLGRTYSNEEKESRSITMKKVRQTQEYKDAQHTGMLGLQNALGHKQTPETIAKRMATMKPIFESSIYKSKLREKRLHQVFPQKDSKPELKLQLALDLAKIKYTKHHPIIGQPDIFIQPNIAIFLDGCYFHGCVACKGERVLTDVIPQKAIANDQIVNSDLRKKGITVIRIWEHEINNDETAVIDLIKVTVGNVNELDKEVKS